MSNRDYYTILGVERDASADQIKKAYRELALKYHPDRNQGDSAAEDKFKEASEAYAVLGNIEKKKIYDKYGIDGLKSQGQGYSNFSFFSDSIFSDFEDILGGLFGFGSFNSSRGGRRQGPSKGKDIAQEIYLTLEEAYKGVEKEIEIQQEKKCSDCEGTGSESGTKPEVCNQCQGSGSVRRSQGFFSISTTCPKCSGSGQTITHPCNKCNGRGRTIEQKKIKVDFPAGIDRGNRLRVGGGGNDGYNGGRSGDLYLIIDIDDSGTFKRQNNDLIYQLNITFAQAALGDEVKIDTFYGNEKIKIPTEVPNQTVLKIKGKGFKNVNGWGKGDFLILLNIITPSKLSQREKQIFKELREIEKSKESQA